ncbi:MAG TPA: glycine betaine ABC transporter substrate-binding protein [Nocardioidaceae bacterium]|nr:glycine betaine ABC transporter substrate-binding protein [Nocardioidaceae bacterium]
MSRLRALGSVWLVLAALVLTACGTYDDEADTRAGQQPQGAALRITLGTQAFPEARILGELWRQALAVNGYTVDLRKGVGPAAALDKLLRDGDIDGHVAYTGTVLSVVAGEEVSGLDPAQTYSRAKAFYDGREMAMSTMTPFQNKDAIATTRELAQRERLRTIADLRKVRPLTLGGRAEFEDLTLGLRGLEERYRLTGVRFRPLELGSQYAALDAGDVQAVNAFTTDPQLRGGTYTVLEDPELLFGSQNVVMTVRQDKLDSVGGKKFLAVVSAVNGRLTQSDMVDLNAEVTGGESDEDVARGFLRSEGLLEPMRAGDG